MSCIICLEHINKEDMIEETGFCNCRVKYHKICFIKTQKLINKCPICHLQNLSQENNGKDLMLEYIEYYLDRAIDNESKYYFSGDLVIKIILLSYFLIFNLIKIPILLMPTVNFIKNEFISIVVITCISSIFDYISIKIIKNILIKKN